MEMVLFDSGEVGGLPGVVCGITEAVGDPKGPPMTVEVAVSTEEVPPTGWEVALATSPGDSDDSGNGVDVWPGGRFVEGRVTVAVAWGVFDG
jgi:hypothetical protein